MEWRYTSSCVEGAEWSGEVMEGFLVTIGRDVEGPSGEEGFFVTIGSGVGEGILVERG